MSNIQDVLFIIAILLTSTVAALYHQLHVRRKQFTASFYIGALKSLLVVSVLVILILLVIFVIQKGLIHYD